ncbi:hypothetical protein GsuE55_21960 [Geobacillus subterraneus]|uniref:Transposase putative helix-turn-helix domain-containing protein n=1 Tax=Geobacillus subterraneus TaxID=129338 RepID=A0A679FMY3_9BACL|nr:hypothetical protein GsuE55_21960 [Geobacillus subterraneus]
MVYVPFYNPPQYIPLTYISIKYILLVYIKGGEKSMIVNKAYKFRLYPNKEQQIVINKTFGCSRFVLFFSKMG